VYIIPRNATTLDALYEDDNWKLCGNCALQGTYDKENKRFENRACYVNLGWLDHTVVKAYASGRYLPYSREKHEFLLATREIRHGAYGDPAAMPDHLIQYLCEVGTSWTGYTHQAFWQHPKRAAFLAKYMMISCHNKAQHAEAQRRGWRSFSVIADGQDAPSNSVECPFGTHGVKCIDCGLCKGLSLKAKSVYTIAHAKAGLNLPAIQAIGV